MGMRLTIPAPGIRTDTSPLASICWCSKSILPLPVIVASEDWMINSSLTSARPSTYPRMLIDRNGNDSLSRSGKATSKSTGAIQEIEGGLQGGIRVGRLGKLPVSGIEFELAPESLCHFLQGSPAGDLSLQGIAAGYRVSVFRQTKAGRLQLTVLYRERHINPKLFIRKIHFADRSDTAHVSSLYFSADPIRGERSRGLKGVRAESSESKIIRLEPDGALQGRQRYSQVSVRCFRDCFRAR